MNSLLALSDRVPNVSLTHSFVAIRKPRVSCWKQLTLGPSHAIFVVNSRVSVDITPSREHVGSVEAGITTLTQGKVDFAASDTPLSDDRMPEPKTNLLRFATVLGAVVPVHNLKDVDERARIFASWLATAAQHRTQTLLFN